MCGDGCRYSRYHTSLAIVADAAGTIPVWRSFPMQPVPGDAYTNAALDNIGQGLHVLIARVVSRAAVLELCHLALDSTVLCCVHWIACIARKHGQTFAVHSQFGYIALHCRSALHWMCSIDLITDV